MPEPIVAGLPIDDLAPLTGDAPIQPPPPPVKPPAPAKPDAQVTPIDWSKVDPLTIPEAVIKQTKPFAAVLTESVERRQQLKVLKDQINGTDTPKPDAVKPPKTDDAPEWFKPFADMIIDVKKTAEAGGRKTLVTDAIATHNLPKEAEKWLTGSTAAEITAQALDLAKTFNTPTAGGASGGGGLPTTQTDRIKAAIALRVKQQQGPIDPVEGSLFNPSIQNRISGN